MAFKFSNNGLAVTQLTKLFNRQPYSFPYLIFRPAPTPQANLWIPIYQAPTTLQALGVPSITSTFSNLFKYFIDMLLGFNIHKITSIFQLKSNPTTKIPFLGEAIMKLFR